ncbi:hypothetical protein BKI52_26965 [marine bacterium AO1-C]|nr:hypothetical protein BKI52_26965 [marine bacterium AO1-C]
MELDELKSLWQQQPTPGRAHSEQDIRAILRQKTHPIFKRIYNKIFIEFVVSAILLTILIGLYIYKKEYTIALMSIFISLASGYLYWVLYKHIHIRFGQDTLGAALVKLERLFKIYDKVQMYFGYLLGSSFLVGYVIGRGINKRLVLDKNWIIALGVIAGASWAISYPVKWYVSWLYGGHIHDLKSVYIELNEIEQEA